MNNKLKASKQLSAVAGNLAQKYRDELKAGKAKHKELNRPDFLWHYLLQSFSTMGRSGGWHGLINNADNYAKVNYDRLKQLKPKKRIVELHKILSGAGVRWPSRKAIFISQCLDRIESMGGLSAATQSLLAQAGREQKIAFLDQFPGIGDKYARNLMMDVYHKDFRDSIAIDSRIRQISKKLGMAFNSYAEVEQFFLDAAHNAKLTGWELDRLMYKHLGEFLEQL